MTFTTSAKKTRARKTTPADVDGLALDQCTSCSATVLVGRALLDHVTLDQRPLTTIGEVLAIATGRRTWTAMAHGLMLRSSVDIRRIPAGGFSDSRRSSSYDVIADHQCAAPGDYTSTRIPPKGTAAHDTPPF